MNRKTIVIKIGGRATADENAFENLIAEMSELSRYYSFILVHGGGAEVTRISEHFGLKPQFKEGIRMTTAEEMEIVDMVLAGKINKQLVRRFNTRTKAVGLSGSDGLLFQGESLEKHLTNGTRTGKVVSVDTALLNLLLDNGYIPVVASTSMDEEGKALNINADEAALHIAVAVGADSLIFLSDTPGVVKDGSVIHSIDETDAREYMRTGCITGGMIPKVNSSIEAIKAGVSKIIICQYTEKGDVTGSIRGEHGTTLSVINEPQR